MQPQKAPCCRDFYSANKQADLRALGGAGTAISAAPWWAAAAGCAKAQGGCWRVPKPPRTPEIPSEPRPLKRPPGRPGGRVCRGRRLWWELCCVSITVHEDQLLTGFPPPPSCKPAGPRRRRVSRQVWQTLSAPSPGESNEARAKVLSGERERPTEPLPSESGQARGTGKSH